MNDPAILFVKPGAITAGDKRALRKAGVVVVEVEDPKAIKLVRAGVELSGSDLLLAAAHAINNGDSAVVKRMFAEAMCAAINAAEKPKDADG